MKLLNVLFSSLKSLISHFVLVELKLLIITYVVKEDFFRKRIPKYGGVGEGLHASWFVLFVLNKCSFWVLLNLGFVIY